MQNTWSCLVQGRTCLFPEYENPHCNGHEVTIGCQVQFIKSDPMGGKVLRTGVHCPGCNATRSHCWRQLTLVRAGAGLRVISRLSQCPFPARCLPSPPPSCSPPFSSSSGFSSCPPPPPRPLADPLHPASSVSMVIMWTRAVADSATRFSKL